VCTLRGTVDSGRQIQNVGAQLGAEMRTHIRMSVRLGMQIGLREVVAGKSVVGVAIR